ncbi:MAG: ketopantoate reductase family protein [Pigmentiphaga sp.]
MLPPDILTDAERASFAAAGIRLEFSDNVMGALWFKLILNCAFNALSAVTQRPYGELWPAPGVRDTVRVVIEECLAVAKAEGVGLPEDPWPSVEAIAASMPGQRSSTAQDLARGKPTEIDYLNGAIVRRGQARGIATPANLVLHTLVRNLQPG